MHNLMPINILDAVTDADTLNIFCLLYGDIFYRNFIINVKDVK